MSERRVCDVTGSSSGTTTFVPLPGLDGLQVADFHRIHDLNVTGAFQATRALGPQVRVSAVAPGLVEAPWLQQGLGAGACHAHLARHQAADAAADHTQLVAREIRRRHDAHQAAIVQIAGSTRWRQRRKSVQRSHLAGLPMVTGHRAAAQWTPSVSQGWHSVSCDRDQSAGVAHEPTAAPAVPSLCAALRGPRPSPPRGTDMTAASRSVDPLGHLTLTARRTLFKLGATLLLSAALISLAPPLHAQTASSKIAADLQQVIAAPTTPSLSWAKDVNGVRMLKVLIDQQQHRP
jgi:hypothetical protein